jgi:hypothetical protein
MVQSLRSLFAAFLLISVQNASAAESIPQDQPAAPPPGEHVRGWVLTNCQQVGDLWIDGELTDSLGNRWNVKLIPGAKPIVKDAGKGFERIGRYMGRYGQSEIYVKCWTHTKDGATFAGEKVVYDFMICGIGDDYSSASDAIGKNLEEKPFGWIGRIIGNGLWGYVIKPVGRIVATPVGVVGGLVYSVGGTAFEIVKPPVLSIANLAFPCTTVPICLFIWHNGAWLVSIFNLEPDVKHDGSFGLEIIRHAGEPAPGPGQRPTYTLTTDMLKDLIGRYVEERRLYATSVGYRKAIEELQAKLSQASSEIDTNHRELDSVKDCYDRHYEIRLEAPATEYFSSTLAEDFVTAWQKMIGALAPEERDALLQNFGSIEGKKNLETFLNFLTPYLTRPAASKEEKTAPAPTPAPAGTGSQP